MVGQYFSLFNCCTLPNTSILCKQTQAHETVDIQGQRDGHHGKNLSVGGSLMAIGIPSKPVFEGDDPIDDVVPQSHDVHDLKELASDIRESDKITHPIFVHALSGAIVAIVQASSQTTVLGAKSEIQLKTRIPAHQQQWTCDHRVLEDTDSFLQGGGVIEIVTMVRNREAPFTGLEDIHRGKYVQVRTDFAEVYQACSLQGIFDESKVKMLIGRIVKVERISSRDGTVACVFVSPSKLRLPCQKTTMTRIVELFQNSKCHWASAINAALDASDDESDDDIFGDELRMTPKWYLRMRLPIKALCSASLIDLCKDGLLDEAKHAFMEGDTIDSAAAETIAAAWFREHCETRRSEWEKLGQVYHSWGTVLLQVAAESVYDLALLLTAKPVHLRKIEDALGCGLVVDDCWIHIVLFACYCLVRSGKCPYRAVYILRRENADDSVVSDRDDVEESIFALQHLASLHYDHDYLKQKLTNELLNAAFLYGGVDTAMAQRSLSWGATLSEQAAIRIAEQCERSGDPLYCRSLEQLGETFFYPGWKTLFAPYAHKKAAKSVAWLWVETDSHDWRTVWQLMREWYKESDDMEQNMVQQWLSSALQREHLGMARRAIACGADFDWDAASQCAELVVHSKIDANVRGWEKLGSTHVDWQHLKWEWELPQLCNTCDHERRAMACMCNFLD